MLRILGLQSIMKRKHAEALWNKSSISLNFLSLSFVTLEEINLVRMASMISTPYIPIPLSKLGNSNKTKVSDIEKKV